MKFLQNLLYLTLESFGNFIQEIATIIHHSSWSSGYDSWIKTPADPGSNPGGENKQLAAISLFNQILCLRIKDLDIFFKIFV